MSSPTEEPTSTKSDHTRIRYVPGTVSAPSPRSKPELTADSEEPRRHDCCRLQPVAVESRCEDRHEARNPRLSPRRVPDDALGSRGHRQPAQRRSVFRLGRDGHRLFTPQECTNFVRHCGYQAVLSQIGSSVYGAMNENVRLVGSGVDHRCPRRCRRRPALRDGQKTCVRFASDNALTPAKTTYDSIPAGQAGQQHPQPEAICKTSIPVQIRAAPPILKS